MIGSGKVIRVGGFNLSTLCSSLLGNRQGGLTPILKTLFANGEQGFAYDPNDLTTLSQDTAGTIPVASTGQPVGLILDKRKGLTLGSELNTTASPKMTGNAPVATYDSTTKVGTVNRVDVSNQSFVTLTGATGGRWYKVSIKNTGSTQISLRNATALAVDATLVSIAANSNFTGYVYVASNFVLGIAAALGAGTFIIDTVREIAGNHAFQTVSASRPILRQTPILGRELVVNGDFSNGVTGWSNISNGTLVPSNGKGLLTASASGVVQASQAIANLAGKTVEVSCKFSNRVGTAPALVALWSGTATTGSAGSVTTTSGYLRFIVTLPTPHTGTVVIQLSGAVAGNSVEFDDVSVKEVLGYRTNQHYLEFDGIDDQLVTTLTTPLTDCTVLRAIPNVGTEIRYNQTIPMVYTDTRNHAGLVAINRNLSSYELVKLAIELDKKVGVKSLDTALVQTFANNEQGFAYDPNDLSSLFQDSTGNTPVTAAGQPVGLVLDKSKGLKIGSELFTQFNSTLNSTLSQNTLPCVVTSTVSVGVFGVASANIFQEGLYKIEFTWSGNTSQADMGVQLPNGNNLSLGTGVTGSFSKVMNFTSTGSFSITKALPQVGQTFTVSAVSIKKIAGNHAFQTVSASRPVLRQTSALGSELTTNGNFSNGLVGWAASNAAIITNVNNALVVTSTDVANAQARQTGTVAAGKLVECSVNFKSKTGATSYVRLVLYSVSIGIVGVADSLISMTSGTLTFTAQVPSNFTGDLILQLSGAVSGDSVEFDDVSMKEVLGYRTDQNYLAFDGIDDFLVTNTIDFTATDKISLFTGLRKLSDVDAGTLLEFSSAISNVGTFALQAPSAVNGRDYLARANGTPSSIGNARYIGVSAPHSAVLTSLINLSEADKREVSLRVNNSAYSYNSTAINGGNFSSSILYIGRRAGSSYPFNGSIYGLVGVGRLTSETEVLAIEQILAKRTGVTLNV